MVLVQRTESASVLNLTPHAVTLVTTLGHRVTLLPFGFIARVETKTIPAGWLGEGKDGLPTPGGDWGSHGDMMLPVAVERFERLIDLPKSDVPCLVLPEVLEAVRLHQPWRRHVYSPDMGESAIFDKDYNVVAVRQLITV